MRTLAILCFLMSFSAFAQYNDGFHSVPEITCTTGECLMVDERPIEMIEMVDREGYSYSKLNTNSSILNILEGNSHVCFSGKDIKKLDSIISALVGGTNGYYVQGGHFAIEDYQGIATEDGFQVTLQVISDYRPREYELVKVIKACK